MHKNGTPELYLHTDKLNLKNAGNSHYAETGVPEFYFQRLITV